MLGMVFTELVEMLESRFSPELVDTVLTQAELPHGGAYTAVGYYPHSEIVRIISVLTEHTGLSSADLQRVFGEHLLGRFAVMYPELFAGKLTLYDFLASIDSHIHVEVTKLYPGAQLPRFEVLERSPDALRLAYRSPRGMVALAEGLIRGASLHYQEPHSISHSQQQLGHESVTVINVQRIH